MHTEFSELVAATRSDVRDITCSIYFLLICSHSLRRFANADYVLASRIRLDRLLSPNLVAVTIAVCLLAHAPHDFFDLGAGNSVFPLLASNQNPNLKLYAFDYSSHAVKLVQVCAS